MRKGSQKLLKMVRFFESNLFEFYFFLIFIHNKILYQVLKKSWDVESPKKSYEQFQKNSGQCPGAVMLMVNGLRPMRDGKISIFKNSPFFKKSSYKYFVLTLWQHKTK